MSGGRRERRGERARGRERKGERERGIREDVSNLTIFIFEEEKVGVRICRLVLQASPRESPSPLGPFGRKLPNAIFNIT